MKSVAFVLYTGGIEYDDRVRKEYISLSKLGCNVQAFAVTQHNTPAEYETSYGMKVKEVRLISRDRFKGKIPNWIKMLELGLGLRGQLKTFNLVWLHDAEMAGLALLLRNRNIVVDLHEVPEAFLYNSLTRRVLRQVESRSHAVIHANLERLEFAFQNKLFQERAKHFVLRNYPEREFVEYDERSNLAKRIEKWAQNSDLVYVQGISSEERFPLQTIRAILSLPTTKAVVAGKVPMDYLSRLRIEFRSKFDDRLFFTGLINSRQLAPIIRASKLSVVLYSGNSPNCRLCEPNRFHQCVSLRVPVVVGKNETLRSFVKSRRCGISVDTFGEDTQKVADGIKAVLESISDYRQLNRPNLSDILWESQQKTFESIINSLW